MTLGARAGVFFSKESKLLRKLRHASCDRGLDPLLISPLGASQGGEGFYCDLPAGTKRMMCSVSRSTALRE